MITHTKRGRVTRYGLACGYQEYRERDGISIEMWGEHGIIHVCANNHNKVHMRIMWQSFHTMKDARLSFSIHWLRIRQGYYH